MTIMPCSSHARPAQMIDHCHQSKVHKQNLMCNLCTKAGIYYNIEALNLAKVACTLGMADTFG